MGQKLNIVGQMAMDDFYQNYADSTSFFLLSDFIQRAANVAADFYRNFFRERKAEIRQEKSDEVVEFESSVLNEQIIKLKKEGKDYVGEIELPAMSFPFDEQSSGYQNVFDTGTGEEIERSSISETWTYRYLPETCRLFYRIEGKKIKVFSSGMHAVSQVRILYVPSVTAEGEDAELPDGMIDYVITTTVNYMRQAQQQRVIKKSLDGNANLVLEAEMNKESLK